MGEFISEVLFRRKLGEDDNKVIFELNDFFPLSCIVEMSHCSKDVQPCMCVEKRILYFEPGKRTKWTSTIIGKINKQRYPTDKKLFKRFVDLIKSVLDRVCEFGISEFVEIIRTINDYEHFYIQPRRDNRFLSGKQGLNYRSTDACFAMKPTDLFRLKLLLPKLEEILSDEKFNWEGCYFVVLKRFINEDEWENDR